MMSTVQSFGEKRIADMRADEARAARDERPSVIHRLSALRDDRRVAVLPPRVLEPEEVARRVDDAEPAAVRRRGAQPNRRLVQELVHERFGKLFDGRAVARAERCCRRRSASASSRCAQRSIRSRISVSTGTAASPATHSQ